VFPFLHAGGYELGAVCEHEREKERERERERERGPPQGLVFVRGLFADQWWEAVGTKIAIHR